MSRSKKKPFVKDKGHLKRNYWKIVRSVHKQQLKKDWDDPDFVFKNPKSIINDYDYCDWWFEIYIDTRIYYHLDFSTTEDDVKKASRK